jgi:hypothetical protein
MKSYPIPQEEQLEDAQLPQLEAPADLDVVSPEGPEDFETNPQADISLDRSLLSQDGHSGVAFPITRVSKFLPQALHLYSYIGIFITSCLTG